MDTEPSSELESLLRDVAVLIPVFNDLDGLLTTLESIEESDLVRVWVVDDGSTPPLEIDPNEYPGLLLKVLRIERNVGIEEALNLGLSDISATGGIDFIARVDAGDIMTPGRLARQRRLFVPSDELVLVGAWADFVDADSGNFLHSYRPPSDDTAIRNGMFRNNMVIHAASMYRLEAAQTVGLYPSNFPAKEDHEFFWRLLSVGRASNLQSVELKVTVSAENISVRRRRRQLVTSIRIISGRFREAPWRAGLGIFRNVLLLAVPSRALSGMKRWRSRLQHRRARH